MNHLATILPLVDWQGIEPEETRKGKLRDVLAGIPAPAFWKSWKSTGNDKRKALRQVGFQLSFELVPHGERQTATGLPSRKAGNGPRKGFRKSWQVKVWINAKNAGELKAAGLLESAGAVESPF